MPIPRPSVFPEFASADEIDPITGNPNKVQPPAPIRASGVKYRQPVFRQHYNYNANLTCTWLQYLDEQVSAPTPIPNILEAVYPIGSVYYSTVTANPSTYGFPGTWNAIGQGRCIVGLNTGDSDFNTIKKTGGSKTHTHGGVTGDTTLTPSQMPIHDHPQKAYMGFGFERGGGATAAVVLDHSSRNSGVVDDSGNTTLYTDTTTETAGSGLPHNHLISSASTLQPYITLAIWERVS